MIITVTPSDNIFKELGNNTYDFKDLLSELVDNSIAARIQGQLLKVKIEIEVDSEMKAQRFTIWDDASGIPVDKIGLAITPAGIQTSGSLNEHGLGMKQAVAAIGNLESLTTKTVDSNFAICISEFRFGNIDAEEVLFDRPHGTTISVRNVKQVVTTHPTTITRSIIPYLGARYRRFLKPENKLLQLSITISDPSNGSAKWHWDVNEVKPIYFHPSTRENRPVIQSYPIEGHGWKAEISFGYAPKDAAEYEELGIDPPNKFHPYRSSLSTQGLDIVLHDRVILFHQLSEIQIVQQRHNDYNSIRGEIVLNSGFSTAITKNSIIHDAHFAQCIDHIREILTGERAGPQGKKENYIQHKSYPDELPEALIRDRLKDWLENNSFNPRKNVAKEYVLEGIEGFIDIFADGEAWELKTGQANALDVYQLFMYMDIGCIEKGFLVAKDFSNGAKVAANAIKEKHKKTIILASRDEFPINHHPNHQEREDYY